MRTGTRFASETLAQGAIGSRSSRSPQDGSRVDPGLEPSCLTRESLRAVHVRFCGAAGEFDHGAQGRAFTLQSLIHQIARFIPGDSRFELRIVNHLLRRSEGLGEAGLGLSGEKRQQSWKLLRGDARIHVSGSRAQQGYAAQLGCVDLVESVVVGVDVNIGPVAEIERRNGDGGSVIIVVIAAARIRSHIGEEFIASALSRRGFLQCRHRQAIHRQRIRWRRRESCREIRRPRQLQNLAATTAWR